MEVVEEELGAQGGPYFLGAEYSLVDVIFAPFLERIAASLAYYKGFIVRGAGRFPNLERWFEAMESRSAYIGTKSDYFTHCHDLPPQLGGWCLTFFCCLYPERCGLSQAAASVLPTPQCNTQEIPDYLCLSLALTIWC